MNPEKFPKNVPVKLTIEIHFDVWDPNIQVNLNH